MGFPADCQLDKRIYKKLFHENAQLSATDKKAFSDDIDRIDWRFKLSPHTTGVPAYTDDQHEYLEIAILEVTCKTSKRISRIAQIIHRAIPYPLMILFCHADSILISLAPKRYSQAEKGAIVADEFMNTDWINLNQLSHSEQSFLSSLKLAELPTTHLLALYSALVERVVALDCARLTGKYSLEVRERSPDYDTHSRRQRLDECRQLETSIAELRVQIKKETQFNRQVELNTQIKKLSDQLAAKSATL